MLFRTQMLYKEKRGQVNIIAVVLAIVFVVAISSLIFTFMRKTGVEETEKSSDKVSAQNICNDEIEITVNNIIDLGGSLDIELENLGAFPITDFVVRLEMDDQADVKKVRQVVGSYESIIMNVKKPTDFNPQVVKVIPRITLSAPEIQSSQEGWWICSKQLAEYERY